MNNMILVDVQRLDANSPPLWRLKQLFAPCRRPPTRRTGHPRSQSSSAWHLRRAARAQPRRQTLNDNPQLERVSIRHDAVVRLDELVGGRAVGIFQVDRDEVGSGGGDWGYTGGNDRRGGECGLRISWDPQE